MIAIIKYNAGNICSVQNAIEKLGYKGLITNKKHEIENAEKVIFPGVGHATSAMRFLKSLALDKVILSLQQPVLGICLGLQLMCNSTEEGNTKGLGIFNTRVKKFPPQGIVPHMGWNNFTSVEGALFKNITPADDMYYVHGYYAEVNHQTLAKSNYILDFAAALQCNNFFATQFHPEKSAGPGSQILKNFLEL